MTAPTNERSAGQRALLRFLQRQNRISTADMLRIEEALQFSAGATVHELLEREGIMTEKDLALLLANTLRLRLIDLTSYPLDPQIARELKEQIAVRYEVVPIRIEQGTIEVATANPLDLDGLKAVEFATGKRVQAVVATQVEVRDALAHAYRLQESLEQFLQHVPDEGSVTLSEFNSENTDLRTIAKDAELPPVVKLADLILIEGVKSRASDIHIEPGTDAVAVRYRVDGILEESFRFPKWVQNPLIARFKVMAKLDITERRMPQDGRIQLRFQDKLVDLRMSSLPAQHGEKITLRILDASVAVQALNRIGLNPRDLQLMREAVRRPQGMIVITGPTGSGKTTTLYALLREVFAPSINIVTIENPIEYQLKGINQVEVNEKQGLTFASVLRSVLRQDPDVILIGEIRDRETAEIAFQAAQTGHLVLSTLHTNDAAAAVTRLVDLGLESYAVASALNLVVGQRLVRRICPACSAPYSPSDENRRLLHLEEGAPELRKGTGCPACRQTGYVGRTGVYELLPISKVTTKIIEAGGGEIAVRQQARTEGNHTLLEDAMEKLNAGLTTAEEVLRVVQLNDQTPRCPSCQKNISDDYAACPHCGTVLRALCGGCSKPLSPGWTTCPYCGSKAAAIETPPVAEAGEGAADAEAAQPRSYKALVVDDNPALCEIVRLTLERSDLGLSVITANDGTEALARASTDRPDVVILDLSMPDMDGFEVCRRLRSDVRTAFVPVLMLTAHQGEDFVTQGFAAGTDDFMTKPYRREDLVARVRRMLERTYGKSAVGGSRTPAEVAKPRSVPLAAADLAAEPLASDISANDGASEPVAPETNGRGATGRVQTGKEAEGQLQALVSLLEQFGKDRDALMTSLHSCETRLAELDDVRQALDRLRADQARIESALQSLVESREEERAEPRASPAR
jgi:type IV pilus assembly protein PilB